MIHKTLRRVGASMSVDNSAERLICRWCGGKAVVGHGPSITPDWVRFRCKKCGTLGYKTLPTESELSKIYNMMAWQNGGKSGRFATGSTNEEIARALLMVAGWLREDGPCLDFGAGAGA